MKQIELILNFDDKLGLKSALIGYNDTGLPDDSELLRRIALTLLKSLNINKADVKLQDLLNELDINRTY